MKKSTGVKLHSTLSSIFIFDLYNFLKIIFFYQYVKRRWDERQIFIFWFYCIFRKAIKNLFFCFFRKNISQTQHTWVFILIYH